MAELSPELASRIQQLETSYAGNPGRFFVALAGAWREAGEVSRAEEILRENLKRFPGLSAHVLLGRCLADRGAYQEAANEFHYVLSIDSQNLIALRTLAEMAQANGRGDEARRWYNELLAVDPMNADARAALSALDQSGADAATADQAMQVGSGWGGALEGEPVAGPASDAGFGDGDFGMVDISASAPADEAAAAPTGLEGWGDIAFNDTPAAEPEVSAPTLPTSDDGFDAFGFGSLDLDADARQDIGETAAAGADDHDDPMLNAPVAGAGLPLLDLGDDPPAHDDGDVDAEVVTETMAELYAQQGLDDRAADVYRTLIEQRGPEPALVRRLAELEGQSPGGAPAAPSVFGGAQEQAAPDWLAGVDAFASGAPAAAAPADIPAPSVFPDLEFDAGAASAGTASAPESSDPFADSFANGFGGGDLAPVLPEPALASAEVYGDRAGWQAPSVTPTEAEGFDLIVVAEDGGEMHIPASAEEVADMSADWAVAAAPIDDHEDDDEPELASASAPAGPTMGDYFQSLLSWQPGQAAPAPAPETPTYEASVDESGTLTIAAASDGPGYDAGPDGFATADFSTEDADDLQPMLPDALAEPGVPALEPPLDEPAPLEAYLAGSDTGALDEPASVDGLAFAELGTDAVAGAPARDDEPWSFPDEPVAAAPAAPAQAEPAPIEPGSLDLDEPWATPAPAPEPVDLGAFTLSDELVGTPPAGSEPAQADDEGLLPWEMPAEPAEPAAVEPAGGGFSFEDFFSGSSTPAPGPAAAPAPAPEPVRAPDPVATNAPAVDPEPYTPSAFAAPTPPPAPAAPAAPAAGAQEEDDEDLESFQAWLQSLKR